MPGDPVGTVDANKLVGSTLDGRYRVEAVLGQGGMGMVFRAVQTSIQRAVAVKTLHPELAMAPQFFERFRREAETASKLKHPNIITIYDFGRTQDGMCYFVMEMLEGESLRQRVKRDGPMTLRQAAAIVEQVALGVGHAHKQGVVHRDIKPHNVMLTPVDGAEYVKVLDFGLVKALEQEENEQLTSTGQVLGTPQYMPPEQAGGEVVDQRSDLYSLTGVFYYCLTGHSPYGANTVRKALQASLTQEVPAISTYRVGAAVPDSIDRFMRKGLAREKEDRFQDADELVESLHAALTGAPDSVLDAVPQHTPGATKESGSGSSSASKKAAGAKPTTKSVSAVGRALPKAGPHSSAELAPPAGQGTRAGGLPAMPLLVGGLLVVLGLGVAVAVKVLSKGEPPPVVADRPPKPAVDPPKPGPTEPATVKVTLKTTPAGAEVLEEGVVIGSTTEPLVLDWPRDTKRTLTFRLAGYKDLQKALKPGGDQALDFTLEAAARPTGGKRPGKKHDTDIGAFE